MIRAATLALPLVLLGTACATERSQGTTTATRPTDERGGAASPQDAQAGRQPPVPGSAPRTGAAAGATDPLMRGDEVKRHASDSVVEGTVAEASGDAVEIVTEGGNHTLLEIEAETSVEIDGRDATALELEEGQPVRASFNQMEGRDVAVHIVARTGDPAAASGSSSGAAPGSGSGTGMGAGGQPDPSSPSERPGATPPRR